jgi:hypothetical protein
LFGIRHSELVVRHIQLSLAIFLRHRPVKICERVLLGGDDVGGSHRLLKHAVELVQKILAMSKQIFCGLLWFLMGDLMGLLDLIGDLLGI